MEKIIHSARLRFFHKDSPIKSQVVVNQLAVFLIFFITESVIFEGDALVITTQHRVFELSRAKA